MALTQSQRHPELMDDRALDATAHIQSLQGLRRVNRLYRLAAVLERAIVSHSVLAGSLKPLQVLDVTPGGGDLAIQLASRFNRRKMPVEIEGGDISDTAVQFAS